MEDGSFSSSVGDLVRAKTRTAVGQLPCSRAFSRAHSLLFVLPNSLLNLSGLVPLKGLDEGILQVWDHNRKGTSLNGSPSYS